MENRPIPFSTSRPWTLLALALLAGAAVACGDRPDPNLAPGPLPVVGRNLDGEIELRFSGAAPGSRYSVYVGQSPDAIDRSTPIAELRGDAPGKRVTIPNVPVSPRRYFELSDQESGWRRIVAQRLLPIEGAHNFRDFGGYATEDGRHVRWGMLFRSDHLAGLSDADLEYIEGLGIRLVCDFRSDKEREADPDRLPSPGTPKVELLTIADESFDPEELQDRLLTGGLSAQEAAELLIVGNRLFATEYRDRYRRLFQRIDEPGGLPVLIHCTAGKDRTGFGAALILRALGVPEETVFEDFLLSNLYSAEHIERTLRILRVVSLFRTSPDEIRPLMGVRREYLEAAFEAIDTEYGSLDVYLRDEIGLGDEQLARLKGRLLE